jgi:opacity protein-like surface antigen
MIARQRWLAAGVLLGCATYTAPGWSQELVPNAGQKEGPSWRFSFTPYVWATGVSGTVGTGSELTQVDISFSDIFDSVDFGVMGLFQARREPWVFRADLFYASLGDQQATTSGSTTIPVNQEDLMIQPEVGYSIVHGPWGSVDGLLGARYWHLKVDIGPAGQPASAHRDWVDGTVGAGFTNRPTDRWNLFAKSDVGVGGSNFTWQVVGGLGYDLGSCCTVDAAYRYLAVDYEQDDGFVYDVHFTGPALGLTLHF